jgi:hypothetical protein
MSIYCRDRLDRVRGVHCWATCQARGWTIYTKSGIVAEHVPDENLLSEMERIDTEWK